MSPAGCAVAALTAVLLAAVAVPLLISSAVSGFFDKPKPPPREVMAKKASLSAYRLGEAVRDGLLTDEEIAHAAVEDWSVERGDSMIRIVVRYQPGPECYQFELDQPPTPGTTVRHTGMKPCPSPSAT